jgi:gas vesicle protein
MNGKMENGGGSPFVLLAFLGGAVLGAVAGLLFAPRPGKETREKIKVLAQDAYRKVRQHREEEDISHAA